ncbi:MAG: hypothetical protein AAF525_05465 [Pseudomonadota bacterium]
MLKARAILLMSVFTLLTTSPSIAANAWYFGTATRVMTKQNGNFFVYIDNPTIKAECAFDRVEFHRSDLGDERVEMAFSMALSAVVSGLEFGLVLDLSDHTTDTTCRVPANTAQGATIRVQ